MGFSDMLTSAVRSHTGLHYVPSFNDFVSGAADDVEALEVGRDQLPRQTMSESATVKGGMDTKRMSNKKDSLPAMSVPAFADVHKVDRPLLGPGAGRANWSIDNARGPRAPSVWQYILASQGKEKLPRFEDMAPTHTHSTIGAYELQKHFKISSEQADAMVAEADRDNDRRISREEFEDIIALSA